MTFIYAEYNTNHNSVDVTALDGHILRIDCKVAEDGLRTTPSFQYALVVLEAFSRVFLSSAIISEYTR